MKFLKLLLLIFIATVVVVNVAAQSSTGTVSLSETEITWTTTSFELDDNGAIIPASVDISSTMEHSFDGYILENDYLRVTLVPEYGGRILSIIYKPTGHEQLYQNPLGLPYGIGEGNFYYDWMMVYGGIFPTFPEPEHGKTWFLPWNFEVITQSDDVVSVAMSFVDDISFTGAPSRFDSQATGLEAQFIVTLESNRKAVDTQVIVTNPTDSSVSYEYWTSITLAPGSEVDDTRVTASAEIIAPIEEVKMPPWWSDTIAQEESTGIPDIYIYDNLRTFENWADMGIAYAYPTIGNNNFWGVINQDNGEGVIRVGDNDTTIGLKIWTWGYESTAIEPDLYMFDERRPYIELWAGLSPEFFTPTFISSGDEVSFEEHYIPSMGMSNVSHASADYLANFYLDDLANIVLQVFSVDTTTPATIIITQGEDVLHETALMPGSSSAQEIVLPQPSQDGEITFSIISESDDVLLTGILSESDR